MRETVLVILILQSFSLAKDHTEKIGDVLSILIPTVAYGSTLYLKDSEGEVSFYKAYGGTLLSTFLLKEMIRAPRPAPSTLLTSFPSGHTSSAFSGAAFIHKRYGFNYAIPAYIGAAYTAYSRVHVKKHYTRDVIAGAALGIAFSWYFTTTYQGWEIKPSMRKQTYGMDVKYRW